MRNSELVPLSAHVSIFAALGTWGLMLPALSICEESIYECVHCSNLDSLFGKLRVAGCYVTIRDGVTNITVRAPFSHPSEDDLTFTCPEMAQMHFQQLWLRHLREQSVLAGHLLRQPFITDTT